MASLPVLEGPPQQPLSPRPPLSLNAETRSSPRRRQPYLRPNQEGPTLSVTISEVSFTSSGRYFLTASAGGTVRSLPPFSGLRSSFDDETFAFPLEANDFDLELHISAFRLASGKLPDLSPRGIMANLIQEAQQSDTPDRPAADEPPLQEVASAGLTLADLLSTPQPAGGAGRKQHRLRLTAGANSNTSAATIGYVSLSWHMEDREAEAREAAERAAELRKQERAAEEFQMHRQRREQRQESQREQQREQQQQRQPPGEGPTSSLERSRRLAERSVTASQAAQDAMRASDFERSLLEAQWNEVLDAYSVVLWLPEGTTPPTIRLTARQAVGLSDAAARRSSGRVAFAHAGLRVHLTSSVAASLRAKVEAKLELSEAERLDDCSQPILIPTACPVSTRAVTAAKPEPKAPTGDDEAVDMPPRHATAPPRPREAPAKHASSISWLDAALQPLRPAAPPPRVMPGPRTSALMRASTTTTTGSACPTPPARVMPNRGGSGASAATPPEGSLLMLPGFASFTQVAENGAAPPEREVVHVGKAPLSLS